MLKSIYVITISVWDGFDLKIKRLEYETLLEAFTEYKSSRLHDCDLVDGHWQTTTLSHRFVYLCEPHKFDKDDYIFQGRFYDSKR